MAEKIWHNLPKVTEKWQKQFLNKAPFGKFYFKFLTMKSLKAIFGIICYIWQNFPQK